MKRLGRAFVVGLILADGAFGAIAGFLGLELERSGHFETSPAAQARWVADSLVPSLRHEWPLVWLPAFLGALTVAPFLLQYLLFQQSRGRSQFWLRAGAAGVVSGVLACVTTAFYLPIGLALVGGPESSFAGTATAVLYGPFLFALGLGLVLPFIYFRVVILGGVAFGLLNAAALQVRLRTLRRAADALVSAESRG